MLQAYGPFVGIEPPLMPFRDAAFAINTFPCSVLDCCRALRKAVDLQHFSLSKFSVKNFAKLSKLENGDLSWIIPGKVTWDLLGNAQEMSRKVSEHFPDISQTFVEERNSRHLHEKFPEHVR